MEEGDSDHKWHVKKWSLIPPYE